jgi:ligand-binding SRPBCC domain-containing protein
MSPDRTLDRVMNFLAADDRPTFGLQRLRMETIVPVPLAQAFAFFADAANLERLTPPWINFRILTPRPIVLRAGAVIDYRIALYGLPIPWRTRIDAWEPGVRFVDRQVVGPYRWWRHEHRFESVHGGTRIIDQVEYAPRAAMISSWLVRRDVGRIFAFRQGVLAELLLAEPSHARIPT